MKKIVLSTKRPWNWKVYLVLIGLILPAALAIVPFSVHQLNTYNETGANIPGWETLVVNNLINDLIICALGGIGLLIANRIGLGLPFVEGWAKREPIPYRFRGAVAVGWISGVGFVLAYFLIRDGKRKHNGLAFGMGVLFFIWGIGQIFPVIIVTSLFRTVAIFSFFLGTRGFYEKYIFPHQEEEEKIMGTWISKLVVKE